MIFLTGLRGLTGKPAPGSAASDAPRYGRLSGGVHTRVRSWSSRGFPVRPSLGTSRWEGRSSARAGSCSVHYIYSGPKGRAVGYVSMCIKVAHFILSNWHQLAIRCVIHRRRQEYPSLARAAVHIAANARERGNIGRRGGRGLQCQQESRPGSTMPMPQERKALVLWSFLHLNYKPGVA